MSCWECTWAEIEAEEAADTAALARGETVPDRRGGRPISPDHWYLADIEEDNAYVETCRNGHSMKMSVQNVRYELLFESGVVATLVGFHRESVSSVVAALERFYEFAIEVFTLRSGVDPAMLDSAWKQLRSSSERQFGAFLLLFLVNLKRPFLAGKPLGTYEEMSNFRNKVIHQGRFPSHEEAMKYARYVFRADPRHPRSGERTGCGRRAEGRVAPFPARPPSDRDEGRASEARQGRAVPQRDQLAYAADVQQRHQGRTDGLRLSPCEVAEEPLALGLPTAEVT